MKRENELFLKVCLRVLPVLVIVLGVAGFLISAYGQRFLRTLGSNFTGGLSRTVTVYSYSGQPIRSWTGKFDVSDNPNETYFDLNGKRVIIQGGIIINEENVDEAQK